MDFLGKPEVFSQNIDNSLYEFSDGFLEAFGLDEGLLDIYLISREFSTAKAILQLAYYEIMDGPDPRVMITGLCRAGHTIQNLLNFQMMWDKH